MSSKLPMAAILDSNSLGYKVKALHWHTIWNDSIAPTPETVYKEAQSTQIVEIVLKKAIWWPSWISDNKGLRSCWCQSDKIT